MPRGLLLFSTLSTSTLKLSSVSSSPTHGKPLRVGFKHKTYSSRPWISSLNAFHASKCKRPSLSSCLVIFFVVQSVCRKHVKGEVWKAIQPLGLWHCNNDYPSFFSPSLSSWKLEHGEKGVQGDTLSHLSSLRALMSCLLNLD